MKCFFENVNIYIYNNIYIDMEVAVACTKQLNCTKTLVLVVVIITDKILMFSLHPQLASDEYPIRGHENEDPRMLGSHTIENSG